ncbi:MAG TPA: glycosyltransferase family 4 protein [Thermoplasmata archaeon]|nr:glycosyltransferase family 4 protein [Thermoplasmata archaeon]
MKVVHVTLRFDAPGGVETYVRELAKRQRAAGDDVEVFASDLYDEAHWERRSGYRATVDGVPVRRFPVHRRLIPRFTLPLMVGLIDALAESGADVIHAQSHRYGHVLQAAAVAARRDIPLVVSTSYHPPDNRDPARTRAILRLVDVGFGMSAYRTARAVAVQSELERRLLAEFAPADRLRLIPPGVDLAEWAHPDQDSAAELGLPPDYALFIGRVAANKGLGDLLAALAAQPHERRRPVVIMGADWGERPRLEALARQLGVERSVVWLGHVPDRGVYRAVLRGASAFVLPSEWEAYGFVLLEAMVAGVPIVATSVGAVPEVLDGGRFGRLVPYGQPEALAAALRAVVDDPEGTQARVAAARAHIRERDWSVCAERFRSLYREIGRG